MNPTGKCVHPTGRCVNPTVYIAADYSHLSTMNEIVSSNESNGLEVRWDKSTEAQAASPWADLSYLDPELSRLASAPLFLRVLELFEGCFAPCLVANFFRLPGGPFDDEPSATEALKRRIAKVTGASFDALDQLLPREAWLIVQQDIEGSALPVPSESLVSFERREALMRVLGDALGLANSSNWELVAGLSNHSCCACWAPPNEVNLNWRWRGNNTPVDAMSLALERPQPVAHLCSKLLPLWNLNSSGRSKAELRSLVRDCEPVWRWLLRDSELGRGDFWMSSPHRKNSDVSPRGWGHWGRF